jgi:transketolase
VTTKQLEKKANAIRQDIIKMLEEAGSGHVAGPLGMADVFTALYFEVLNHNPKDPDWAERDAVFLSNGHIAPVLYTTLAHAGYFPKKELATLRKFGSRLQGHPERTKLPGIENTSGPLGNGLGQAVGFALDQKLRGEHGRYVYCLTGDGELNEGVIWEGIMLAAKYHLYNLTVIVDRNNIQIDGLTEEVMPLEDLKAKWQAFGWHVLEVDGHNIEDIVAACNMAKAIVEKPVVVLAHTIPGKGVDFMQFDHHWHGYFVDSEKGPKAQSAAKEALNQLRSMNGKIEGEHK